MILAPLVIIILLAASLTTLYAHESHQKCKSPYKELWVYTFPPQAECVILTHPNAHEEQKIKKENLRYNVAQEYKAGEAAGEKNSQGINFTSWSCSPGNSENFCLGWNQTSCNSEAAEEIMHV